MQVTVLFFGLLKDVAGRSTEPLSLPEGASVADLLSHYAAQMPRLKPYLGSLAVSVNQEYAAEGTRLRDRDEVGLLPPVSGGRQGDHQGDEDPQRAIITRERIDTAALVKRIQQPEDGALVVFEGVVRNNSRGRPTLYLDYEAYEEMARKQLDGLATQALARFAVREVAIAHRLGRLQIGETSVVIVVGSAHRAAAFEACRWIIDTLKKTVPIWKKEYFEDGAVWADGEPFPEDRRVIGRRAIG